MTITTHLRSEVTECHRNKQMTNNS